MLVINTSDESLAHPFASVIITLKLPAVKTHMLCVVSPVDQCQVVALPADSWRLSPWQNAVSPAGVMTGMEGSEKTVVLITSDGRLVHPLPSVISTEKLSAMVTVIDWVVLPFDQSHCDPVSEVSFTLSPSQNEVAPSGVTLGFPGSEFTVTVVWADSGLSHPFASVITTL